MTVDSYLVYFKYSCSLLNSLSATTFTSLHMTNSNRVDIQQQSCTTPAFVWLFIVSFELTVVCLASRSSSYDSHGHLAEAVSSKVELIKYNKPNEYRSPLWEIHEDYLSTVKLINTSEAMRKERTRSRSNAPKSCNVMARKLSPWLWKYAEINCWTMNNMKIIIDQWEMFSFDFHKLLISFLDVVLLWFSSQI